MKTSTLGLMALCSHEGLCLTWYLDSVKVPTIGIGHTASAGHPDPLKAKELTVAQAFELFRHDIQKYEKEVLDAVKVPLAQHEFDALVSFHYNTGGIKRANLTRHLNAGDRKKAAEGFMGWLKPPEIQGRREAEQRLFMTGKYPAPWVALFTADAKGKLQKGTTKLDLRKYITEEPGKVEAKPESAAPAALIFTGAVALVAAVWGWVENLPCSLFNLFCGG